MFRSFAIELRSPGASAGETRAPYCDRRHATTASGFDASDEHEPPGGIGVGAGAGADAGVLNVHTVDQSLPASPSVAETRQ